MSFNRIQGLTMGMSVVTIFEILHHVAMLFVRTGAKSLGIVRRTIIIPNKSSPEIDGLGNGSEIKVKKSLGEHLDSVNNQHRQQSSTNEGFIKQSVFIWLSPKISRINILYSCHYNPRFKFFQPPFCGALRLVFKLAAIFQKVGQTLS